MEQAQKNKHKYGQRIVLLLLFAILSFVIVSQIRARDLATDADRKAQQAQMLEYQTKVDELEQKIALQKNEIGQIEVAYNAALKTLKESNQEFYNLYQKYTDDLDAYRKKAGLTAVQGPGVIIRLDDSNLIASSIIHDTYLVETVNVLKEAGAQAISVNGQRILSTTEILCLGPSIRINGSREFPPYHIYAIGDPEVLNKTYRESSIFRTIVAQNLIYDIQQNQNVVVNAYSGNYKSLITKLFS